jgi:hypothetical protein
VGRSLSFLMSTEPREPRQTLKLPPRCAAKCQTGGSPSPWILGVEHILADAGNPAPARNCRDNGRPTADLSPAWDSTDKFGANDGASAVDIARLQLPALKPAMRAERAPRFPAQVIRIRLMSSPRRAPGAAKPPGRGPRRSIKKNRQFLAHPAEIWYSISEIPIIRTCS